MSSTKIIQKEYTYSIKEYEEIFKILNENLINHNNMWISQQPGIHLYNLKKTYVKNVITEKDDEIFIIDQQFYDYMTRYKNELIYLYAQIIGLIKELFNCNIIGRIKNEESILNKLQKKKAEQNGSFSINKVLNDLLGFRIIDKNFGNNINKIKTILDNLKEKEGFRILHKERINGDYRGYHIYFMGKDAKHFPLELQVWDTKSELINLDSHEIYKKDYTSWPEIYFKG
ncbi:nucleotidyltransferase family protein [Cytobacillus kochii]|uniref:RelA/SpoT domain-containing protein n=1 Tax=Cytobacillus kochii TaxID=859143 RepID=A0A248THG8_9BACI|nr:hypothetical protein [Cytobacillus kochii]ASV67562.1 hypothetical protein CKF48_09660 [Cytobacillus kochii]